MSDSKDKQVDPNAVVTPAVAKADEDTGVQPTPVLGTVQIPLSKAIRAAYQELYDEYENAIQDTADVSLLESLNDSKDAMGSVLFQDAQYAINQSTTAYESLQVQIKSTNAQMATLQKQIQGIADGVQTFGTVLAAIDKVAGLVGV